MIIFSMLVNAFYFHKYSISFVTGYCKTSFTARQILLQDNFHCKTIFIVRQFYCKTILLQDNFIARQSLL